MYDGAECLKPSSSPAPVTVSETSPARFPSEGSCAFSPPPGFPTAKAAMVAHLRVETEEEDPSSILELAANNDLEGFRRLIERDAAAIDEIGPWYGRKKVSGQMVLEQRTPLMVAATYGSVDVLKLVLSFSVADVNRRCGSDGATALHCAASGGSAGAVDAVKVLLFAGADPGSVDAQGHRPCDVIVVSPKCSEVKIALEELLGAAATTAAAIPVVNGDQPRNLRISVSPASSNSPPLSSSVDEDGSPSSDSTSSPMTGKFHDLPPSAMPTSERKEYPIDPSLPDIKNSIYATDEFRMFSFKVRPCSRAYSHDWTECPFVHPGENARRRDPRKYHYSCVPCPDFRKGACRRGDLCEYAHGVFECWLHPAQYRTRLCKDGTGCSRRVCFFAHTSDELRPLYVSTGSAVPSPRSSASAMELAAAMSMLPGSPSSMSMMSLAPFTPPISPSAANGISHSSLAWPQPNVPTLNLPGISLQSSRLRSSFSARDIPADDFSMLSDFDSQQLLNDFSNFSSAQARLGALVGNLSARSKTLTPSNLDDLFSAEMCSSPRYDSDQGAVYSPSHKTAVLNQFQQQQQGLLSPINTNVFSPRSVEPGLAGSHSSLLQASLGISPPGRMSPRCVEPISPMSGRLAAFAQREKQQQQQQQQQQLRTLSSRELVSGLSPIVGSPVSSSIPKWGSPAGKPDWGVNGDELADDARFKRSSSFDLGAGCEEPDLSWVQSLVKESPPEIKEKLAVTSAAAAAAAPSGNGNGSNSESSIDHTVLSAWLEQMQLDQVVP